MGGGGGAGGRGGSKLFSASDLGTHPFRVPLSQFAGSLVMSVMPAGSFASITDEAFGLQGVDLGPTQPLLDDLVDFGLPAPLDALSLGAGGSLFELHAILEGRLEHPLRQHRHHGLVLPGHYLCVRVFFVCVRARADGRRDRSI